MNKGYAFGFLIVLLVLILGLYVAFTGFVSSREALRFQPTPVKSTQVAQVPSFPTAFVPTIIPTLPFTPALTTEVTTTLSVTPTTAATEAPLPTDAAADAPTEPPITSPAQPAGTPGPAVPPPTPIPAPAHQFRLAGPPAADADYPICCYVYGMVRDAAGNGLEGIRVQVSSEWTSPAIAVTKGGSEMGKYDAGINTAVVNWEIALVDVAGNPISTRVQIQIDANEAQGYRVDWQRTY